MYPDGSLTELREKRLSARSFGYIKSGKGGVALRSVGDDTSFLTFVLSVRQGTQCMCVVYVQQVIWDAVADRFSEVNFWGQRLTWGHTGHLVELGVVDEVGPVPVDEGAERQAVLPASRSRLKGQKVKHVTSKLDLNLKGEINLCQRQHEPYVHMLLLRESVSVQQLELELQ